MQTPAPLFFRGNTTYHISRRLDVGYCMVQIVLKFVHRQQIETHMAPIRDFATSDIMTSQRFDNICPTFNCLTANTIVSKWTSYYKHSRLQWTAAFAALADRK